MGRQSAFPHQSTGDQWFDESQFESYRALGYHIAKSSMDIGAPDVPISEMSTARVFEALHAKWRSTSRVDIDIDGLERT